MKKRTCKDIGKRGEKIIPVTSEVMAEADLAVGKSLLERITIYVRMTLTPDMFSLLDSKQFIDMMTRQVIWRFKAIVLGEKSQSITFTEYDLPPAVRKRYAHRITQHTYTPAMLYPKLPKALPGEHAVPVILREVE